MSNLTQQFEQQQSGGVIAQASSSREMEEVKGQIFMAKQFPRDVFQSEKRILDACKRPSLAKTAVYRYPRGKGNIVEGPSIRLAEVCAQNWGNIAYGIKELEQKEGESVALAYCWDLETNVRQEKTFTVRHIRDTKNGPQKLKDQRDIYELVANNGARRVRACILGVIPGDVIEMAVEECNKTLQGENSGPLKDRVSNALSAYKEKFRVTKEMIEDRFGYPANVFTETDYADLIKIFTSLKEGASKVDDWFDKKAKPSPDKPSSPLAADMKKEQDKPKEVKDDVSVNDLDPNKLPLD